MHFCGPETFLYSDGLLLSLLPVGCGCFAHAEDGLSQAFGILIIGLVNYVFYKLIVCGKLAQILTKPVTSPSKLIYLGSINQFNEAVILICDRSHSVLQVNCPPLHPSSSRLGWSWSRLIYKAGSQIREASDRSQRKETWVTAPTGLFDIWIMAS